ncbi:MAG TPA: 2-succinylbenzoate--CoA ligase, partial [Deltaproteobacteria bacterium]|nr:2-succinylbenzoate--CoA ligase [Deltaproteobacteria bacterium]
MLSLHDASIQHPNRVALVVGEAELTYRQLWEQVAPIVDRLRRSGLSRVGLVAGRDLSTLRLLYALLETGICAVLLHPKWGRTERDAATRMAKLDYIVDTGATDPMGGPWPTTDEKWQAPSPEDIAAVVFTSGSTGRPRGVRLSRRALMAAAHASEANLSWRDDDRWLLSIPLAHIGGLSIVTRCLAGQRAVVLQPENRFEPGELIELVEATSTTLWSLVPTMLTRLLRARPELTPPQSLRAVLVGGATAPTALIREARERRWPILTTYGLTEASAQVATQPADQREAPPGAVGLPLPGVEVRVIDGEVQVRGATLFSGYLTDTRSPDTKQP